MCLQINHGFFSNYILLKYEPELWGVHHCHSFCPQECNVIHSQQCHNTSWPAHSEAAAFPYHFICKSMPLLNASDQPEFMNKIFSWVQYNRMFQSMHITRSICSMSVWQVGTGRLLLADGDTDMLVVICMVSAQQLDRTDRVRHLRHNSEEGFPPSGSLAPELN